MNRVKMHLLEAVMLGAMASGPYGLDDRPSYSPTPCKEVQQIPGYHHEGIYSQPKKLRKGAGHKKLTRAQRKKMRF